MGSSAVFSMKGDSEATMSDTGQDGWEDAAFPGNPHRDPTTQTDWLDQRQIESV
jgi:hypothetical protein